MNDIMKMIKSLEEFSVLIYGVSKTIKYGPKEQKYGFLGMLRASVLGNLLTGKVLKSKILGKGVIRAR